ncbi:MAG: response regulator, partial [Mucilaginibacter sp.]|nr:response regulator [Mucilaginibacter sp.]
MLLEKIILNLLNNAFKYTDDNGQVDVEVFYSLNGFAPSYENELVIKNTYRAENYFYIRVKDNGIGISKESIGHLFERYYRIASAHLGSGVGLAFVKSLTLLHKGDIFVCSERNKGTEIVIGIPYGESNYSESEKWTEVYEEGGIRLESPAPQIVSGNLNEEEFADTVNDHAVKHRILLVDDNNELRDFLKGALASQYEILEATDGVSGLSVLNKEYVDLIISDIMMPGMDGIDFCKAVKNDLEISHI